MTFQEVVGVSIGVVVFVGLMSIMGRIICIGSSAYDVYEESLEPRELKVIALLPSELPSPAYLELFQ